MKIADTDGSGEIDYSEWIVATKKKKKLLSNQKMETAFNLFDRDGSGSISAQEVKDVLGLGKNIEDNVWNQIV